ncbi:MAG: nickel pincer cofactor biosynthesis protein LarC [Terracidiphilus sp.]
MRTAYLECFSGISGDMMLGALVDAGVPFERLEQTAVALNVGARLAMHKVTRGGIAATKIDVITPDTPAHESHSHQDHSAHAHGEHSYLQHRHDEHSHPHHEGHSHHQPEEHSGASAHTHAPHRSLSAILNIIRAAPLADPVKDRAIRAFQLLGAAEAGIHSIPVEEVHFHEVGAVDTIVDIVCAAAGAAELNIGRWLASPLNVGSGTVVCQHGTLPVPAPATLALLGDAPIYAAGAPMERVTPTGAALLRMLDVRYAPLPSMRIAAAGYGAGGRETPGQPNLLRLLVGEEQATEESAGESIAVLETVIDDSTPQLLAYASELLLAAGAWDVYRTGVQMKKGRTGVQLTVLCHPDKIAIMRDLLFHETSTIGLRWRLERKVALKREFVAVKTQWGQVRIKVARWFSGAVTNASPEYEDCRAIAAEHSIPLKQVMQEAMRIYLDSADNSASAAVAATGAAKDGH